MTKPVLVRMVRAVLLTALLLAAAFAVARAPVPDVKAAPSERPLGQTRSTGDGPNKAAVAVKYGDGHVESVCVSFPEQNISGGELLERSELELAVSPEGAVCSIGGEGCPSDDCFCLCKNLQNCEYWAFYQWEGDRFVYSSFGVMVDTVIVSNGTMHGWAWGSGNYSTGAPPPDVTFDQVCTTAAADPTATPTSTPTATATATATFTPQSQPSGPTAAPQVTFTAAARSVATQQCTTLSWSTVDATAVTLEGAAVSFTGSEQVCPQVTHTYTLIATNTVGQTARQISIQVLAASAMTPTPAVRSGGTPGAVAPTPAPRTVITQPPAPLPGGGQERLGPTPDSGLVLLTPGAFEGGGVPLAPTAESLEAPVASSPAPTPTPYVFRLPTETPRPRRELAAGAPTPTPLLMARAAGGAGQAPSAKRSGSALPAAKGGSQALQSRAFTPELLPQYAAYFATVAALLIMGWFTLRRRRSSRAPVTVTEPVRDEGTG